MSAFANCGRAVAHVRGSYVPILLQKSFLGDERNFLGPLMRFGCADVRDLIVSHKTGHGPAHRRYGALQQWRCLKICFREIFGIVQFSTFATISAKRRHRLAYSITSSASPSSVGGTSMPSARAVFRLITNSNLVGCWIGKSPVLHP